VNVSPTTWLRQWFRYKDDEEQLHPLWWVRSLEREATREELSKAVHNVMIKANINRKYSVTSIRKAAITAAISSGANKQ
jgi:hypothetical protein